MNERELSDEVSWGKKLPNWGHSKCKGPGAYYPQVTLAFKVEEIYKNVIQPRGVGWGGRWEGGSRGRGRVYTYGRFMLMYGRNQHNVVKQLSSN